MRCGFDDVLEAAMRMLPGIPEKESSFRRTFWDPPAVHRRASTITSGCRGSLWGGSLERVRGALCPLQNVCLPFHDLPLGCSALIYD